MRSVSNHSIIVKNFGYTLRLQHYHQVIRRKFMSKPPSENVIALNKKARHDYFIEQTIEAGLELEGWEVKSLRLGKAQLTDTYVVFKKGEAWLLGAHISPISTISTHKVADPTRTRKLLLNKREITKLFSATQEKGFSCVPLKLYWKNNRVKCEIALVKGKKLFDKRESEKQRDWEREKQRLVRHSK